MFDPSYGVYLRHIPAHAHFEEEVLQHMDSAPGGFDPAYAEYRRRRPARTRFESVLEAMEQTPKQEDKQAMYIQSAAAMARMIHRDSSAGKASLSGFISRAVQKRRLEEEERSAESIGSVPFRSRPRPPSSSRSVG